MIVFFCVCAVQFSRMDRSKVGELMVITGNSHPELADLIAKYRQLYIFKNLIEVDLMHSLQ